MNADVSFGAGLLDFTKLVQQETRELETMAFTTEVGFSALAVTKHMVRRVGLFDEAIWPAYVEDCDLMLRIRRTGKPDDPMLGVPGQYMYYPHLQVNHKGSQSSKMAGTFNLQARMSKMHKNNALYYVEKWGAPSCSPVGCTHVPGCGEQGIFNRQTPFDSDVLLHSRCIETHRRNKEIYESKIV